MSSKHSTLKFYLASKVSNQKGRTLIEIMIALTIGLMMTAAIMGAFIASQQTGAQSNAKTRMVNEGTQALNVLGRVIRQAGFSEIASATKTGDDSKHLTLPVIHGCDGGYATVGNDRVAPFTTSACKTSFNISDSDSITLSMQVHSVNCTNVAVPVPNIASFNDDSNWGGDILGKCVQAVVNSKGVPVSEVSQRFEIYVPTQTAGAFKLPSSLYVKTTVPNTYPYPLLDNIEQLKVKYLVSNETVGEGTQYMTATQVNLQNKFKDVVGVSVCILVSADQEGTSQKSVTNDYTDCNGTLRARTDSKLRMSLQNTYLLRNRATPISHTYN